MDLFEEKIKEEEKNKKLISIDPPKHYKRYGKKRPIEKMYPKKIDWREDV
jgi:hypothetical protein